MAVIEKQIEIARPPQEVFDYLSDLRNERDWNPGLRTIEKLTDGPVGLGTRYRAQWKGSPLCVVECVRYEPPLCWTHTDDSPLGIVATFSLTPVGDGTRVDTRFELQPRGVARLLAPVLARVLSRTFDGNLARAKARLEYAAAPVVD